MNQLFASGLPQRKTFAAFLFALPLGCASGYEAESQDGSLDSLEQAYTSGTPVTSTENGSAPFGAAVLISTNGSPLCTGVKIGAKRFLTAGHCLSENTRTLQISNGLGLTAGSSFTTTGKVFVHPSFQLTHPSTESIPSTIYDLAVFDVLESSTFPILPTTVLTVAPNVSLTSVGYGKTGTNCGTTAREKLKAGLTSGSDLALDRKVHFIVDFGDPSSCKGDSGGPLIRGTGTSARVVGIDSASSHPANPANSTTVFTRLSNVIEWINEPLDSTLGNVAGLIGDNKALFLMNASPEGDHPSLRCAAQNGTGGTPGADVRLHPCDGVDGFFSGNGPGWRLLNSAAGGFKIVNRLNGLCMTMSTTTTTLPDVFVTTCATSGSALASQSWTFEAFVVGSGPTVAYRLKNVFNTRLCLATSTGAGNENDNVCAAGCNSTGNQQWFVTR